MISLVGMSELLSIDEHVTMNCMTLFSIMVVNRLNAIEIVTLNLFINDQVTLSFSVS